MRLRSSVAFVGASALLLHAPSRVWGYDQSDLEQLLNSDPPTCTGCDLAQADLENGILGDASIQGTDLSDARLTHAYLKDADLSGATLLRADLTGANLTGAHLTGVDLSGARLCRTIMPDGAVNSRDCPAPVMPAGQG